MVYTAEIRGQPLVLYNKIIQCIYIYIFCFSTIPAIEMVWFVSFSVPLKRKDNNSFVWTRKPLQNQVIIHYTVIYCNTAYCNVYIYYTLQSTVYTIQCIVYTVYYIVTIFHHTVYEIHCGTIMYMAFHCWAAGS